MAKVGHGTAWSGHLFCTQESRRVRFPYGAFCVFGTGTQDVLICQLTNCQWKRWHHGDIAQVVEQRPPKPQGVGSNPSVVVSLW